MPSLTAANAIITLSVPGVISVPQQLQQFSVDDVADVDTLTVAETLMGVDGHLSGGFVYKEVGQAITLQADSPSVEIFDNWWVQNQVQTGVLTASGTVILPALGKRWTLTRGFLKGYKPIPSVKKILQPQRFSITWERVRPAPA